MQGTLQVEYTIPSILDFNYVVSIVLQCQNRYICNKYSWQKAPMLVLHQKEKQDRVENVLSLCKAIRKHIVPDLLYADRIIV